jgi:methyl-accepting chemotaxis protein
MRSNPIVQPAITVLRRLPIAAQVGVVALSATAALAAVRWGSEPVALVGAGQFLYLLLAFGLGVRGAVAVLRTQLNAVCAGDLAQDIALAGRDELAALGSDAQRLSHQLSLVVARIRSEAQLVAMSGNEATQQARSLSQRTDSQAASLQQTRAGLGTLLDTVRRNAEQVREADARAAQVNEQTASGQAAVQASVESMHRIEQRARQMGDIIGVIDSIAFQTNLLALNAAVEAARAGDAGRGFAVVAAEVRMLAQRSAQSAAEVKQLIRSSNDEVTGGVQAIERSHESLAQAVEGIRDVAERLREFARSSDGQNASLQEIAQAVATLDDITQHNARMAEGSVHTADQLRARAGRLSDGVHDMRLRQGCADEAKAMAERAVRLIDSAGTDEAVRQFHDPKGAFRDRDLYVVVADRDDYFRAFGSDPTKAGKLRKEAIPSGNQNAIRDATWRAVEAGGGWIEFHAPHPITKRIVDKLGYVAPALGGRWAVLCSVNRGDGLATTTAAAGAASRR